MNTFNTYKTFIMTSIMFGLLVMFLGGPVVTTYEKLASAKANIENVLSPAK